MNYSKMNKQQQEQFNNGFAYGNSEEGKENAPGVQAGLRFWEGWESTAAGRQRMAKDFGDNFSLITSEDEIPETMRYCALKGNQYQYWTPFEWSTVTNEGDITGLMIDAYEGEIVALWATYSSCPWSNEAMYTPLPVRWFH